MSLVARPAHAGRRARSAAGPGSGAPGRGRPDTLSRPTRHAAVETTRCDSAPGADPGAASASRIRRTEHTDPAPSTHRSSMKTSAASSHISYVYTTCDTASTHLTGSHARHPEAELGPGVTIRDYPVSPTAATAAELRIHTPTCEQSRERTPQTLMDDERTSARLNRTMQLQCRLSPGPAQTLIFGRTESSPTELPKARRTTTRSAQ